jgi:hypothetical protein
MAYSFIRSFIYPMMKNNQALTISTAFSSFVVAASAMKVGIKCAGTEDGAYQFPKGAFRNQTFFWHLL